MAALYASGTPASWQVNKAVPICTAQHDKLAAPMADAFTDALDLTPYTFIANQISRDALNVASAQKLQKAWQQEVAHYFPRGPNQQADLADPNLLDRARSASSIPRKYVRLRATNAWTK